MILIYSLFHVVECALICAHTLHLLQLAKAYPPTIATGRQDLAVDTIATCRNYFCIKPRKIKNF